MWKDIKNWEDYYEINEYGEVRNKLTGYILKGDINSTGYYRVCLYNKNHTPSKQRFFRHRLVAEHFIDNPDNLPEVNHKDHILQHYDVYNLEWCTKINNELDLRINGAKEYKPFEVVFKNGKTKIYSTQSVLSKELNISKNLINHWLHNRSNTYKNYNIISIKYI